jgi:hypothetical protein
MGILNYKYSHYYVRLEEGKPQPYKRNKYESYEQRFDNYIKYLRSREITLTP